MEGFGAALNETGDEVDLRFAAMMILADDDNILFDPRLGFVLGAPSPESQQISEWARWTGVNVIRARTKSRRLLTPGERVDAKDDGTFFSEGKIDWVTVDLEGDLWDIKPDRQIRKRAGNAFGDTIIGQALAHMACWCPTIDVAQAVGSVREVKKRRMLHGGVDSYLPVWDEEEGAYRLPGRNQDMILPIDLVMRTMIAHAPDAVMQGMVPGITGEMIEQYTRP